MNMLAVLILISANLLLLRHTWKQSVALDGSPPRLHLYSFLSYIYNQGKVDGHKKFVDLVYIQAVLFVLTFLGIIILVG